MFVSAGDSGGVNVNELVRVVRGAALSRTEIQILTDALLNKHHDQLPEHSEWTEVTLPIVLKFTYVQNKISVFKFKRSINNIFFIK